MNKSNFCPQPFAFNLKKLRNKNNLSITALASLTKISVSTLSRYETANQLPSTYKVIILAKFFNISVNALLGL